MASPGLPVIAAQRTPCPALPSVRRDETLGILQEILARTLQLDLGSAVAAALLVNVLLFAVMLALGELVRRTWRARPVVTTPPAITRFELVVAAVTVVLNSAVMLAGWLLFRQGILAVDGSASVLRWLRDALMLVLVMDLAMYALHRLAHHPLAFRWVHGIHHRYDQPRPLTLFVLHPLEVVGFGGLWIAVLCVVPSSLGGMLIYLTVNSVFGIFGHVGVEPMPDGLPRWPVLGWLGTSTFHARHHQAPRGNFGFYTGIWDVLFGTLDGAYRETFGRRPRE